MDPSVKKYLAAIGKKGGAAGRGSAKARPAHVARRAMKIREAKRHLKPGYQICPRCNGCGENEIYYNECCAACGGAGQVPLPGTKGERIMLRTPRGVRPFS